MAVKIYKPTSPGRRLSSAVDYSELTKKKPEKSLIRIKKRKAGRSQGKITVRHRGGGSKKYYRLIDFKQQRFEEKARVLSLEYDPNRSGFIALIQYADNQKSYIIAPQDLKVGDEIITTKKGRDIKIGNRLPLENIPVGMFVHNIELKPDQGGKIVRAAGQAASVMSLEGDYAQLKMPSGEVRLFSRKSMASIGQVSNIDNINIRLGKAGRSRHRGIKPTVRGKAMNPADHPHGGGEGHQPIGLKHPKTPWGKPALGVKTRRKDKYSDKLIIKRRK